MKKTLQLKTKDYLASPKLYAKAGKLQTSGGFTLVETLVALFIFSVSITAIIVVTGQGVSDTTIAKNRIIAVALSQEGIEVVRNIRDTYSLSEGTPGAGWNTFVDEIAGGSCGSNGCRIVNIKDNFLNSINSISPLSSCGPSTVAGFSSDCEFLTRERLSTEPNAFVNSSGFYDYEQFGSDTPFRRTLYIECVDPICSEVKVESLVEWRQGTGVNRISSVEYLFNWFKTTPVTP